MEPPTWGCFFYNQFKLRFWVPHDPRSQAVVAELFHGPTYCFKDLGQQLLVPWRIVQENGWISAAQ